MTVTQIVAATDTGNSTQNSATTLYNAIDGIILPGATEAVVQCHIDYTLTGANLYVLVATNTLNGTTTVTSRKGGVNGNLTVSIATTLTGVFEDTAHTDSYVSGNLVDLASVTAGSAGSIVYGVQSVTLAQSGSTMNALFAGTFTPGTSEPGAKTLYTSIRGNLSLCGGNSNTNEASSQFKVRYSGTWSNLRVYVSSNTLTVTTTITSRIGAANGTQTVPILTTQTGAFQDSAHTDAIVSTNLIDIQFSDPAGSGGVTILQNQSWIQQTSASPIYSFSSGDDGGDTSNGFYAITGSTTSTTATEAGVKLKVRGPTLTGTNFLVVINTNTAGSAMTCNTRDNGANGALTVSVGSNTTGTFEDTTHTDTYHAAELIDIQYSVASANINTTALGVQVSQVPVAAVAAGPSFRQTLKPESGAPKGGRHSVDLTTGRRRTMRPDWTS